MPTSTSRAVARRDESAVTAATPIEKIKHELELRIDDIRTVLPPSMDVRRFARVSLLAISKNPDLLSCTPSSIIRSIIEAAEIGLEPTGSLNRAWLVPFKPKDEPKQAQLMIGYQGYADLIREADARRRVVAEVVYEGDHFKVIKGTETPRIEHEPAFKTEDPTKITHAYAIVFYPDGTNQFEVMTRVQIELARAKSKQRNGAAWTEGYGQMSRKTALRRLSNYTPLSAKAADAIARDDEREYGEPGEAAGPTRTAAVRSEITERIAARNQPAPPAGDPAPAASAAQQPAAAADTSDAECGATSDPALGDVEECVLDAGHANKDGSPSAHESKGGTKFPNKAPA